MALASGIPCVDTLAFQLSVHRLDERRSRQSPFSFSLSEPFHINFAGKPHSNPKRSRSLPNPIASKRKEIFPQSKDENQNNTVYRQFLGKVQGSLVVERIGFRAYAPKSCNASIKKFTSPLHEYANSSRTHKESEEESSDEELNAVAKKFSERQSPSLCLSPHKLLNVTGVSGGSAQPRVRKRVLDENELCGYSSKRARPTVDFEKMLCSAVCAKPKMGERVPFEDTFFKPIVGSELEDN